MGEVTSTQLDFFAGEPEKLAIYLGLHKILLDIAPRAEIRVHKTAISFCAPRPFAYISLPFRKRDKHWPEHHLVLSFSAQAPPAHPRMIQSTRIRRQLYTIHAVVLLPDLLDGNLTGLVAQSQALRNPLKPVERL